MFELQAITSKMKLKSTCNSNESSKKSNIIEKKNGKNHLNKQKRKKLKQKCVKITKNSNNIESYSQSNKEFDTNILEPPKTVPFYTENPESLENVSEFKHFCDEIFNPNYYVNNDDDLFNSQA